MRVSPKDAEARFDIANIYLLQGKAREAMPLLREAVVLGEDPRRIALYVSNLVGAYETIGCVIPIDTVDLENRSYKIRQVNEGDSQETNSRRIKELNEFKNEILEKIDQQPCSKLK
jgi:hypothetical protein